MSERLRGGPRVSQARRDGPSHVRGLSSRTSGRSAAHPHFRRQGPVPKVWAHVAPCQAARTCPLCPLYSRPHPHPRTCAQRSASTAQPTLCLRVSVMSPYGQACTLPSQPPMKVHGWLMEPGGKTPLGASVDPTSAHTGDVQTVPTPTVGAHSQGPSPFPDPASVVYSPLHESLLTPPHRVDNGSIATQQRLAGPRALPSVVAAPSAPTPTAAPSAPTLAAPPSASTWVAPPSTSKESSGDGGGPPHAKQESAASVPRVAKVFMPFNLARPLVSASGKLMRCGTYMGAP